MCLQRCKVAAGVEATEIVADVSEFVDCVVGVDPVATAVVPFVVVEVQPAIRRPQSKRLSRTRDVRMESMFFAGGLQGFFRRIHSALTQSGENRSPENHQK